MKYPDAAQIKVLVDKNPKQVGTACWYIFEYYKSCKTVGEFRPMVKNGRHRPNSAGADLTWNVKHKFIQIQAV
jgi:hypothetical protein